ncbi:polyprenyl synthetase family protein [Streptomyces pathocidini]|uniref:Polyprenyl synthetase family protein n=1 Tax=Streptomyces pathocidini TaxID=1650571 RepID=A0ABW7UJD5_9ACTN|nr:polyprenyl synthetase family protein [Streptomyces pathocidini]
MPDRPLPVEDRITATFPGVRRYLAELLRSHGPDGASAATHLLHTARTVLANGRRERNELALPLLTHATLTGDPDPAIPIAGVHALWWRAANAFDDVADSGTGTGTGLGPGTRLYGLPVGAVLMASLECGYGLPLRALAELPVPAALRERLTADYLGAWTATNDGQIKDILHDPTTVGRDDVLATYRRKSGSAYAMACGMAARLSGAGEERVAVWRRFGETLGLLAQFNNDHEDLATGRGEDLRNRTATYLLVHALDSLPGPGRERALTLLGEAGRSPDARRELTRAILTPGVLIPYRDLLAELRDQAHAALDTAAPAGPFRTLLRRRVDAVAQLPASMTA